MKHQCITKTRDIMESHLEKRLHFEKCQARRGIVWARQGDQEEMCEQRNCDLFANLSGLGEHQLANHVLETTYALRNRVPVALANLVCPDVGKSSTEEVP